MFNNIKEFISGLTPRKRLGIGVGIVVILMITGGVAYWSFSTTYGVLFADLQMRDSASIVSELDKLKIPYRLADGAKRILVPKSDVYTTRLKLMGKGIPITGGVGFEIFDKSDFGMTEFAQRINYQRALQGELARTIMSIQDIRYARVQLVLPETSLFKENKTKPKASVGLIVADGVSLTNEEILGIQRLVAAAVPELSPAHVTIVDQRGVTLSRERIAQDGELDVSDKLDLKKAIEKYLEDKVASVMDRAFGAGKAIVSVDATIDMDKVNTTVESMIPLSHTKNGTAVGGLVRRSTVINRSGTMLLASTAKKGQVVSGAGRPRNSTSEEEYKFGRKIQQVATGPGNIRRLSVGVLVSRHLSDKQIDEMRHLVSMAVGFDAKRGDAIAIYPIDRFALGTIQGGHLGDGNSSESNAASYAQGSVKHQQNINSAASAAEIGALADVNNISIAGFINRLRMAWQDLGRPYSYIASAVLSALLIAFMLMLARLLSYRPQGKATESIHRLSDKEREMLLRQIQEWLDEDDAVEPQGLKA